MKLQVLLCAILAVVSANSMAAANGKDPVTKPALPTAAAAAAASQSPHGPYYVEFGEFVYGLLALRKSDHSDPVDVNDLSIELVYDDASYWFDLVL
jgi:hypothetical protein